MSEPKRYRCALCRKEFEGAWSDDEANAEARDLWGVKDASQSDAMVVVCDPCWQRIKPKPFVRVETL